MTPAVQAAASEPTRRGVFVVFEGVDRSGKSTQCARLVAALEQRKRTARLVRFPERSTAVGALIDKYLRKETELDDRAVHLLFSANRWEAAADIRRDLARGVDVVCDRYAYSGVAFSAAKGLPGLDLAWCKAPDAGLPEPDVVIYLVLANGEAERRGGYGDERYERRDVQARVRAIFDELRQEAADKVGVVDEQQAATECAADPSGSTPPHATKSGARWHVIDAARDVDAVHADVDRAVADAIATLAEDVGALW
mmetsp:Transcript_25414/g.101282  ORF Transcript_25414/g.101282 Transcript_25414/m.101282 type:complete len:254 (-) Transcript_25414:201-962(-)